MRMPGAVIEEEEQRIVESVSDLQEDEAIVEDVEYDESEDDEEEWSEDDEEDGSEEDESEEDEDDEEDIEEGGEGAAGNESSNQRGMNPVTGVSPVIEGVKIIRFATSNLVTMVFKSGDSEIYLVFVEPKVEDLNSQLQTEGAQQFRMPDFRYTTAKPDSSTIVPTEEEEELDETGLDPRDIDLLMTHSRISRTRAVKALKIHNGDIVSAVQELPP